MGIGSGWRARALWLWGSPKDSGLFSPSGVWGGWWAPGAGTEVAGSLVALSKELGAERVPLRPAWRSPTLSRAWQGPVGSAALLPSVAS